LTSHLKHDILKLIRKNYFKNMDKSSFVPPQKERVRKGKVFPTLELEDILLNKTVDVLSLQVIFQR
jgi:hypothetical protein